MSDKEENYSINNPEGQAKVEDQEAPATTERELVPSAQKSKAGEFTHGVVPNFYGPPSAQQLANPTNKRKSTRYTWWNFLPWTIGL